MKKAIYGVIGGAALYYISFSILVLEIHPIINALTGICILVGAIIFAVSLMAIIILSFIKIFPRKNS